MQSRIAKQVLEGLVSHPGALWPPIATTGLSPMELITVSAVLALVASRLDRALLFCARDDAVR